MSRQQEPADESDALLSKADEDNDSLDPSDMPKQHKKSLSLFNISTPTNVKHRQRHRKNKSSISDLIHSIREYDYAPIREDFRHVSGEVRKRFVQNLNEFDRGHVGFLDMNMTRSISVLPEDIADFAHQTTGRSFDHPLQQHQPLQNKDEEEVEEQQVSKSGPKFEHYAALFLAVVAVSSKSTAFHMLHHVEAPLKQYWKMVANSFALLPFAVYQYRQTGIPQLSLGQWLTFMAAIVCYSVQSVLFVKALEFTTVGNACIYANSQALLLIIGKACVGDKIHWLEGLGVLVAFAGAMLCTEDAEAQSSKDSATPTDGKVGDGLALLSAVAGVCYLTFAKAVRPGISVTVFVFSVMFVGQLLILLYLQLTLESLEYNLDMFDGVFGWLNVNRLPVVLYMVLVVNSIGTMGFVRAWTAWLAWESVGCPWHLGRNISIHRKEQRKHGPLEIDTWFNALEI
eukprot:scaffold5380_cov131-Cylindrotheca_fusiformis.AAC.22